MLHCIINISEKMLPIYLPSNRRYNCKDPSTVIFPNGDDPRSVPLKRNLVLARQKAEH